MQGLRQKRACGLCGGTGIITDFSEIAFFECAVWCKCDAGQKLFGGVVEVMGKVEQKVGMQAAVVFSFDMNCQSLVARQGACSKGLAQGTAEYAPAVFC